MPDSLWSVVRPDSIPLGVSVQRGQAAPAAGYARPRTAGVLRRGARATRARRAVAPRRRPRGRLAGVRRAWLTRNLVRPHARVAHPGRRERAALPAAAAVHHRRARRSPGGARHRRGHRPRPLPGISKYVAGRWSDGRDRRPFVTAGYGLAARRKGDRRGVVRLAHGARRTRRRPARQGRAGGASRRAHRGVGAAGGLRARLRLPPQRATPSARSSVRSSPSPDSRSSTATSARSCGGPSCPAVLSTLLTLFVRRADARDARRRRCAVRSRGPVVPRSPLPPRVLAGHDRPRGHRGRELPRRPAPAAGVGARLHDDAGRARLRRVQPRLLARLLPCRRVVRPPPATCRSTA